MYLSIEEMVRSWRRRILIYWTGVLMQIFLFGFGIGILGVILGKTLGIIDWPAWSSWPFWLKIAAVVAWIVIGATIIQYKRGEKEWERSLGML